MQDDETARPRDRVLTALAVMMGLMALSNFAKPITQLLDPGGSAGFVLLGSRLHGAANAIVGPLFGLYLAAYAYGAWTRRRWVLPLAVAYAAYVILNLILFSVREPVERKPPALFMTLYAAVAIGVSSGGACYLARRRDRLEDSRKGRKAT
ncbi:MAG: hypothetical protein HYY35_09015 [Deltaproteobacteria bacterium]|nr:hypothetical protein [Deltaproteobacteria bacterium]